MDPGAGYWINAAQAVTLTYPASVITPTVPVDLTGWLAQIRAAEHAAGVHPTYQWMNFYGAAVLPDGAQAPPGTVVLAVDPQGTICGATVVAHAGRFGMLACYADDPTTIQDEGGLAGDSIRLVLSSDGVLPDGQQIGLGAWISHGSRQETAPPLQPLQPPQLASNPSWQQVHYGDAITETLYTATFSGMPGALITANPFWSVDAGPWQPGLPDGLSLLERGCVDAGSGTTCEWGLSGQANILAGSYTVELRVNHGDYISSTQTVIVVDEEITGF